MIGGVVISGGGRVIIGDRVRLEARSCPVELHAFPGAEIRIGNDVLIEAGVSIEAKQSVHIGDHCALGRFSKILDNNFHPLRGNRHDRPSSEPVIVEDDVELGPMTVILPGVVVPRGSAVGAGKVLSRRSGGKPASSSPGS